MRKRSDQHAAALSVMSTHRRTIAFRCYHSSDTRADMQAHALALQLQTRADTSRKPPFLCPQAISPEAMLRVVWGFLCRNQWKTLWLLHVSPELQRSEDLLPQKSFSCGFMFKVTEGIYAAQSCLMAAVGRKQCIILSVATFISSGW